MEVGGHSWTDEYEALTRGGPLPADELERLATAAYMLGRDADYFGSLERAHQAHLDDGEALRAARCAFWVGINLMLRGETGPAMGWMGRAQRLVEREGRDCAERGYLLLPAMFRHEAEGDLEAAAATAGEAVACGERFGDRDLFALAAHSQGAFLISLGRVAEGLALLDEAMVAVTAGELSPIASGLVYCGVILGCQAAYEPRRAQEWTAALTGWCEQQPDMVAFTGRCLAHRAELMWLHGAWPEALEEARRAARRSVEGKNELAAADALYVQGEVHRLAGELAAAEEAYREASRSGREPQPGLALLRLAQGDGAAAAAAIRRALGEAVAPPDRARLLPAQVEILLARGEVDEARAAAVELTRIADGQESRMLAAMAARRRGSRRAGCRRPRRRAGRLAALRTDVAAARGALRGGARACDRRARVPRARRRGHGGVRARGRPRRLRRARRGAGPRARGGDAEAGGARRPRADGARAGGAPPRREREEQPRDRLGARPQRAHRRAPPAEHLRQARGLLAHRRERARVVRNDHAAAAPQLVNPGDARRAGRA